MNTPAMNKKILIPITALPDLENEKRFVSRVLWICMISGLLGLVLFLSYPQIDLLIVKSLNGEGRFPLAGEAVWSGLRRAIMIGFGLFYVGIIVFFFISWKKQREIFNLWPINWLYMILCSLIGPLLLTNMILKAYVGRPRPKFVEMFGGNADFVGAFQSGGSCVSNCSFVSGEVSSMVMIFACLLFASQKYRKLFAILLIPTWAVSAYLRVGVGAHFPSDVFFAGIFMIAIAAVLYWWMFLSNSAQKRLSENS